MNDDKRYPFRAMALMSAILSQLVGTLLVGIFGGRLIDRYLGTSPAFLVIGLLLGLSAGIYAILQTLKQYQEKNDNDA